MIALHELGELLDRLEIGISMITWSPQSMADSEWLYVNEARCRLTGYSKDELLGMPPISITTRESIAQTEKIVAKVNADRRFTCESTILHKSQTAVPVIMHMKLIERDGRRYLLIEHHDIREHKKTEARLNRAREIENFNGSESES